MTVSVSTIRRAALAAAAVLGMFVAQQAVNAQSAPSKDDAEGIIFERQQVMKSLDEDAGALGEMAAGIRKPDKLAETAKKIAQGAKDSLAAFKPNVPGGRSKPEVWSNNADFTKRMEAFAANAEKMSQVAQTGNLQAVVEMLPTALPCKECHDLYRTPKKPAA